MLPKVSAALSKFISPIASSTSEQAKRDPNREGSPRRGFRVIKGGGSSPSDPGQSPAIAAETSAVTGAAIQKFQPKDLGSGDKHAPPREKGDDPDATTAATPGKTSAPALKDHGLTPGHTLLQLMAALDLKRGISKLFGAFAYRAAIRNQKSSGRIRKGAVLDEKAE